MIWISSFILIIGCGCVLCRPERVYNKGFNTKNLPPGGWTSWFNVDHPGGTGDYETIHGIVRHFGRGCEGIPCRKPIGIKVISVHGKSPFQEGDRVVISPRKGLMCTDSHQSDHRCADYKVRFYCPGMRQKCHKNKNDTEISNTRLPNNQIADTHSKLSKLSSKRNKNHENEISKNVTKARGKRRHTVEQEPVVENSDFGAAFHKHVLWNDQQRERRKSHQSVYVQWKKTGPHNLSKWRHWM